MKVKILSMLLCGVLVVLFAACGKQDALPSDTEQYDPDSAANITSQSGENPVSDTDAGRNTDPDRVNVTIPEGYTLVRISWLLEENGICSSEDFINAAQRYDLSKHAVLADVKAAKNVCFPLEGYLFPATYTFKKGTDPNEIIDKMVITFSSKITDEMNNRAKELGKSVHEILTIASIIEKEAFTAEQRTQISSVLYNRLKQGMKLQCDVTVKYCTGVIELQYPDKIDTYKYDYNTYRCNALPAGPICNPGMASIKAALYPDKTDYLYFVINTEPPYESVFSVTYEEHQENCKRMGF